MQYWIRNTLVFTLMASLSGCNVFLNNNQSAKNYRVSDEIKIPDGLEKPYRDPEFVMSSQQYKKPQDDDKIMPPAQIFNLAAGSWVEEGDKQARIFFDKSEGITDLKDFIWTSLNDFLLDAKVNTTSKNEAVGELETDWYSLTKPEEVWFWETEEEVSKQRFKFVIEQKDHQRTASVKTELVAFESSNGSLTPVLRQRLEVSALNAFVSHFDFKYRQLKVSLQQQKGVISLELGFDNKGNSALVTEQKYDLVFRRFSKLLEDFNFIVNDSDNAQGLILTTYNKPDESVWDSIWGDDVVALPIESGEYQMLVEKTNTGGTSITWMDNLGETLEPGVMNDIHHALLKVLRKKGVKI